MSEASLQDWQQETEKLSGITTELLDKLGRDYKEAWDALEAYQNAGKHLAEKAQLAESRMNEALAQSGKEKYYVEKVGTFSFTERTTVQTPKTDADKQALAKYLEKKGGKDLFWRLFGINSNTLQSFFKGEKEEYAQMAKEAAERGETVPNFYVPGLGSPVSTKQLRFTGERSK